MVYFFSVTLIFPQSLDLANTRVWMSDEGRFSEISDIQIRNGKILKIQNSKLKNPQKVNYALPGFCDAYVTLGVNPWGGQAGPDSLKITLQTIISHGFTHVESVGDGNWISKVQNYTERNTWKGPIIFRGRAPIIPAPDYDIPKGTYEVVRSDEEMKKILSSPTNLRTHIFHRNLGDYIPNLRFLYKLRVEYAKNQNWVMHTFADTVSSAEALATGWNVIFHPINASPPQFQLENIKWSPLMSIYYFQTIRKQALWEPEREKMLDRSAYFNISFKEVSKDIGDLLFSDADHEKALSEYKNYLSQLRSRSVMKKNLIFASGTGYPLVYPGVGALKEMEIWEDAFAYWEKSLKSNKHDEPQVLQISSFWSKIKNSIFGKEELQELAFPQDEPVKIPDYRIQFFNTFTRNSCEFIGAGHKGVIQKGGEANMAIYESNPLAKKNGLNQPMAVILKGRIQSGKIIK
ncbi:MAG: hypothetical protein JJT78_03180 [Leptospira sp.]|nr:hypothetical protein [Leptospira sp.]